MFDMYSDLLLDHSRHPRNSRTVDAPTCTAIGVNHLCGDESAVSVRIENELIVDCAARSKGCVLCIASASLMTTVMCGRSVGETKRSITDFVRSLVEGRADISRDLQCLSGAAKYPARVKCVTLPWRALESALTSTGEIEI